jgi:LPXTG-motif cell wall-anchored protein
VELGPGDRRGPVTGEQRRTALVLMGVAALLGLVGWLIPDERLRALAWILAVPVGVAGAVTIAWDNASTEVRRRMSRD